MLRCYGEEEEDDEELESPVFGDPAGDLDTGEEEEEDEDEDEDEVRLP